MNLRWLVTSILLAATAACGEADLVPLAELDFNRGGGANVQSDTVIAQFGIVPDFDFPDSMIAIRITAADSGRVIVITADNGGPEFGVNARRFTDGVDTYAYRGVSFPAGGSGSGIGPEAAWIAGGLSGEHVPDFAGYEIGAFEVHFDRARILIPGTDPNGDGNWTTYSIVARIIVLGRPVS